MIEDLNIHDVESIKISKNAEAKDGLGFPYYTTTIKLKDERGNSLRIVLFHKELLQ